ncbi:MAG: hypothetical protein Q4P65_02705 [Eubacteriales bacterium]|nr:hypothetical protein [Eubacteriales bacterium]
MRAWRRAPYLLYFTPSGLVLDLYIQANWTSCQEYRGESFLALAVKGIKETWEAPIELVPEVEEAFLNFIQRRQPRELNSAVSYLDREIQQAREESRQPQIRMRLRISCARPATFLGLKTCARFLMHKRRAVRIYFANIKKIPSHVGSPLWRRFWGFFRYFYPVSLGFNWSLTSPGYVVLNTARPWRLDRVAAHEFGHIFGLGDAYAAIYRFFSEYEGSSDYLMNSNGNLSTEEFAMFLRAQASGRAQFFPIKFSWRTFWRGLKAEFCYYFKS